MSSTSRAARLDSRVKRRTALVAAALLALAAVALGITPAAANDADDASRAIGQVSAGYTHTCAVLLDGKAACWGNNDVGQSTPPDGTFTAVTANGYLHSCGLRDDGTITCWGGDSDNQSSPPSGTFLSVSAGSYHTCGVATDGHVACWGKDDDGRASPPDGSFRQVSAGDTHTCGLRSDGTAQCWGSDSSGQVSAPEDVFSQISAGTLHSCGLHADGTVACWGSDESGQSSPPDGRFVQISAGYSHTCGLAADGRVTCWGDDAYKESSPPSDRFVEVSAGYLHSCGMRSDGAVSCWGWDSEGQSTRLPENAQFRRSSITAGDLHSCGIADDSTLTCWGSDSDGQSTAPDKGVFIGVSAGTAYSCGLHDDGGVECWGRNDLGQASPPNEDLTQLSAGARHACGIHPDGTLACWGDNARGQSTAPDGTFTKVSAGDGHACALAASGAIACWGDDALGQTGAPDGAFRDLSAGGSTTCAIAADGTLACWGDNALGQAAPPEGSFREVSVGVGVACAIHDDRTAVCWGDPDSAQSKAPDGSFLQLSAGAGHTCGLLVDGTRVCWGSDSDGQASPPIPGAPVLMLPVPDQTATEDADFEFTFDAGTFVDANSPQLTYTATLSDGSRLPDWLQLDPGNRTFRGRPADPNVGITEVKLIATDDTQLSMSSTFRITVENTPDTPRMDRQIADQRLAEDTPYSYTIPDGVFVDDDLDSGDTLTYSATLDDGSPLPGWLSFDAPSHTFSGIPTSADVGTMGVIITVTDSTGLTATGGFRVIVSNTNDPPVVAQPIADQTATEDSPFKLTVPPETFTDEDTGDQMTLTASLADGSELPAWLKFDAASRTFSGTPADEDVGTLSVSVVATDLAGTSATATFALTVANTNDAPTLAGPIPDQAAVQSTPFTFVVPAGTFADVDSDSGDTLTLSANSKDGGALPRWLTFDPATGTFSGTPADRDVGSAVVSVTATDQAGASVSDTFAIAIADANDAPVVVDPIPDQLVTEGEPFALTIDLEAFFDADADTGDTLTFSATRDDGSPLPAWLVFDPVSRSFLGTPATADIGILSLSVVATDRAGASVTDTFAIQILAAHNDPTAPTVTLRQRKTLTIANAVPVLLDWSAGAESAAGGRASYRLELRRGNASGPGTWALFATVKGHTSINKPLPPGRLQLRIQANVPGAQPGPFVEGDPFVLSVVQDSSASITYNGNWSKVSRKGSSGGTVRRTTQGGASATLTADAQAVGLVLSSGPTLGSVRLCVDAGSPGELCRDLDLGSQPSGERRLAAVFSGLAAASHTITITATGGQVLVDAIIVLE